MYQDKSLHCGDEKKKKELSLAAIVGMGGIGKSTLARKIYNHSSIDGAGFEQRAWVVVTSEFEVEDIIRQLMNQLTVSVDAAKIKAVESIQGKMRRVEILQEMLHQLGCHT